MADELNLWSRIRRRFWFWWYNICPKHNSYKVGWDCAVWCEQCHEEARQRNASKVERRLGEWMN